MNIRFPRHLLERSFPTLNPVPVPISEPEKKVKKQVLKFVQRSSVHKKGLIPLQVVPTPVDEFLESLDGEKLAINNLCSSLTIR